jgi:hypothetical protein
MRTRAIVGVVVAAGGLAFARPAPDPVGIYAVIEHVTLDPATGTPARVQLWGAFALAERTHDFYTAPKRGYMYFSCPATERVRCDADWADFRWHEGSGKAIGFGDRAKPLGRVRLDNGSPTAPDPYPSGDGVIKMASKDYPAYIELAEQLKAALGKHSSPTSRVRTSR